MAFWKKSDDPWDMNPEKRKKKSDKAWQMSETQPEKPAPELTPPPWARKEEPLEQRDCPWCGQAMRAGHLYDSSRGMQYGMRWIEGETRGFLDSLFEKERPRVDFGDCMAAWYCEDCRKMTIDTPEPPKVGPNYVWEGGKVKLPEEE